MRSAEFPHARRHLPADAVDAFDAAFAPRHSSFLRLNYYPICNAPAAPETRLAAPASSASITDAGAVTVSAGSTRAAGIDAIRDPGRTEPDARREHRRRGAVVESLSRGIA